MEKLLKEAVFCQLVEFQIHPMHQSKPKVSVLQQTLHVNEVISNKKAFFRACGFQGVMQTTLLCCSSGVLFLKSRHNSVRLTPDNTTHSGGNTLCLLGANWDQRRSLKRRLHTRTCNKTLTSAEDAQCALTHKKRLTPSSIRTMDKTRSGISSTSIIPEPIPVICVGCAGPSNFADLSWILVKFNMLKTMTRSWQKQPVTASAVP